VGRRGVRVLVPDRRQHSFAITSCLRIPIKRLRRRASYWWSGPTAATACSWSRAFGPVGEIGDRDIVDIPASVAAQLAFAMPKLDGEVVDQIAGPGGPERQVVARLVPVVTDPALSDAEQNFISVQLRQLGYLE
jgi:hypothetical protein